ncbi:hypothetical protein B0J18DRAFT_84162 [Chaetomium sp. MPI-SDFR-AT-0129]|nr:hypothetical protein B0J18DRAFT_84162 [Chaetomium sp. MPI-SDFR-AT-0129]
MAHPSSFANDFLQRLASRPPADHDLPTFDFSNASDRDLIVANSTPETFHLGTGASIFTRCLLPAIASARHEVILVTCFWARSKTLTSLSDALTKLAIHRQQLIQDTAVRGPPSIPPLNIRICLSSRSLFQKLLHPQSRDGLIYPPSSWEAKLGLPDPSVLEAGGIHLRVKSLFFLPFSVMHPKFVIIDRQKAFVPSCNVSWEPWLEGCVELSGGAVGRLLEFYSRTWEISSEAHTLLVPHHDTAGGGSASNTREADLPLVRSTADQSIALDSPMPLPTFILGSSHHQNPRFRPFPWQNSAAPPGTPLNVALFQLFEKAQQRIYVQTPNLTCEPVIAALLDALTRGVDVTIVTSRNMMVIEQLITAGTTTGWKLRSFIRRYQRLRADDGGKGGLGASNTADVDLEAGLGGRRPGGTANTRIGRLRVSYFRAKQPQALDNGSPRGGRRHELGGDEEVEEPVHSHLKLTIVDGEYAVLGSGNLDRASFFTSQELGIMFQDREFCATVKSGVDKVLDGRLALVFESDDARND